MLDDIAGEANHREGREEETRKRAKGGGETRKGGEERKEKEKRRRRNQWGGLWRNKTTNNNNKKKKTFETKRPAKTNKLHNLTHRWKPTTALCDGKQEEQEASQLCQGGCQACKDL